MAAGIAGRIYRDLQKDEYITGQDAAGGTSILAAKASQ
jgi:hypothetical protein